MIVWRKERAGGHGRPKWIMRKSTNCDVCRQHAVCLGFDSSEEEYYAIYICADCADNGYEGTLQASEDQEKK